MDLLGQQIAGLQLIRLIGKGALARVFLASDGETVRAVKVFPEHGLEHAEREFELGSTLDHPNLNRVLEFHSLDNLPALLLPFVKGRRLSEWVRDEPGPDRFIRLLTGAVAALEHLAGRGIVHRDVKPENLIVDEADELILIDYDIATRVGSSEPFARMAGTLAFLSPEQAGGQPVTPASDLYSLGALMFWGLCGEVPFSGEPAEVISAHLHGTAPKVSSLRPDLKELDGIVAALLAKQPADRPDHATLQGWLSGLPAAGDR